MKQMTLISRLGLMCLVLGTFAGCTGQEGPEGTAQAAVSNAQNGNIQWAGTWDAAFFRARSEEKVVLVTFYADWCIWCKKLEDTTLADTSVANFLAENTVPVRLDVDGDGRDLSDQYRVDGLPTVLLLSTDGTELGRIPGYLPPEGFLERVRALVG
ncbi:MAG: thioredoxin fold domain-containing protein [Acidobacteria bacterium]|nr:thioredoxin fold domain-containing protein [Acidobacteriota bacterium]